MKNSFKRRYVEGLKWMRMGEGLPQMMYIACIICEMLIFCTLDSSNAITCTTHLGISLILGYLLSGIFLYNNSGRLKIVQFLIFVILELILTIKTSAFCGIFTAVVIFIVPIIVGFLTICLTDFFTESNSLIIKMYDEIDVRNVKAFGALIIISFIPTMIITIPLFWLGWNVFIKIAIIVAYILATPLICYGDLKGFNIFDAMGFEW